MKLILLSTLFFLIYSCKPEDKTRVISAEIGNKKLLVAEDIFNLRWIDSLMPVRKAEFNEFNKEAKNFSVYHYKLDYSSVQNPVQGIMESRTYFFDKIDSSLVEKLIYSNNITSNKGLEYLIDETDEFNLPIKDCRTFALLHPHSRDFKGFTINYIKDNRLIQSKILFNKFFPIRWEPAVNKLKSL